MIKKRLIAVVIIRDGQVVQSVKFKHTNVIHSDAIHAIEAFNQWSVDEIVLLNVSKSDDSKAEFLTILKNVSKSCFVPLSVGGWVNDFDYAIELIRNGADKLVLNTALFSDENLLDRLIDRFGSQCIVASVDFDYSENGPSVFVDRGMQNIDKHPKDWAIYLESKGVGEIFLNCISKDGARKGYDLDMLTLISSSINIPLIAFGGVLRWKHLLDGFQAGADAVAAANVFHYTEHAAKKAKQYLYGEGIDVRQPEFMN